MRNLLFCLTLALCVGRTSSGADGQPSTIRLRVHVEDRLGQPVAKAQGTLFRTTPQTAKAMRREAALVITKAGAAMVARTRGVIETDVLPVKTAYVLEIDADGFAPELTRWTHPQQSGAIELPPVKLRRLGTVKGTVANRQGEPVANVTVIEAGDGPKRQEAVSGQKGQFVLNGVPEGKIVVCFEAADYRFHGAVLSCPAENVRIELERTDDPHPRVLKRSLPSARDWTEERRSAAAEKLLDPLVACVLAKTVIDEADLRILAAVARTDPERILARIDDLKFIQKYGRNLVQNSAVNSLIGRGKSDAALQAAAMLKDPQNQLDAYLYWFYDDHGNHAAHRLALEKARALIVSVKDSVQRGFMLCQLATQLANLGENDGARDALRECQTLLTKMPEDARGRDGLRVQLATALARDDLEAAKRLAAESEPGQMLRLASEIARHRPKEVEPFLANVSVNLSLVQLRAVGNNLPQLCYRLARHDPAAAERVLLKFAQPPQPQTDAERVFGISAGMLGNLSQELIEFQVLKVKAVCYGLIADAAAKRDPSAARRSLLQGIELLRPLRKGFLHPASQFYHTPAVLMALLIPVAERIDPALANEIFWRALSLRISLSGESNDRLMLDVDTADLVDIVKFFDEPLAADLLDPILSRLSARSYSGMPMYIWAIRSLTLTDPQRAISFPNSLSELPGWDGSLPRNTACQCVANVLTTTAFWDHDARRRLHTELAHVRNVYGAYLDNDDDNDAR